MADYEIIPKGRLRVRYKTTNIPYHSVAKALQEGNDIFYANLKRQTAHQAAKKLSKMTGAKIVAVPAMSEDQKQTGYGFITEARLKEQLKANGKVAGRGL
jgi:hypothetical protein